MYKFVNKVIVMGLQYIKHKLANAVFISKIVTIHYFEFDKAFNFEGEKHDFWEMVYVDSGEVEIYADEKVYHLRQGNVIFHEPNEFHSIRSYNESSNVFVITFVCASKAINFFKDRQVTVPSKLRRNISEMTQEFFETYYPMSPEDTELKLKEDAPIGGQQMIRTHLEQFLILLIRNETDNRKMQIFPSKESMENHLVSEIMNIIDENIYKKISVDEICQRLSYSRAYISKVFKSATGYSPLEYILKKKIHEAKKLIRDDGHNFTQISEMLAFDNPHYFSTVFKRLTNMSPSEYKTSVTNV